MANWHAPVESSKWGQRVTEDDNPDDVVRVRFRKGDDVTHLGLWWKGGLYRKTSCWIRAETGSFVDLDTML